MNRDDPAVIAEVHREAHDDLVRLMPAAHDAIDRHGAVRGAVEMASGLLAQPSWTRMMVASVLGVALTSIALADGRRCPSCDHQTRIHYFEGCRYTVKTGTPDANLVCPCSVPEGIDTHA